MAKPVGFYAVEDALSIITNECNDHGLVVEKAASSAASPKEEKERDSERHIHHKKRFSLKPLKFWDKNKPPKGHHDVTTSS
jgi:hypothetical protein